MAKALLVGLLKLRDPSNLKNFNEYYLGHHILDTARRAHFLAGTSYKLLAPTQGMTVPDYITIYELDTDNLDDLNAALAQPMPDATPPPAGGSSMEVLGAGWYGFVKAEHTKG